MSINTGFHFPETDTARQRERSVQSVRSQISDAGLHGNIVTYWG